MNLKWDYHCINLGSSVIVATMYKGDNTPVLHIYKGRDSYFSRPFSEYRCFIDSIKVPFSDVDNFVETNRSIIPVQSEHEEMIKYVCTLFEANFKKQANKILSLLA